MFSAATSLPELAARPRISIFRGRISKEMGETLESLRDRTDDEYWKAQAHDYCDRHDSKDFYRMG